MQSLLCGKWTKLLEFDLEWELKCIWRHLWVFNNNGGQCLAVIIMIMSICVSFCSLWIDSNCFSCQQNTSPTWFTCDTFPSGKYTSSPSCKSFAWLFSGSSSPPWLPSYSLSWYNIKSVKRHLLQCVSSICSMMYHSMIQTSTAKIGL